MHTLVSFSWITSQPLREEIAKFYCTVSSFHDISHLVHDEAQSKDAQKSKDAQDSEAHNVVLNLL